MVRRGRVGVHDGFKVRPRAAGHGPGRAVSTSGKLYPFAFTGPSYNNNYQVWAGKCRQKKPPAGINQISISPGSTPPSPVTVEEPELDVFVYYPPAPTRVKATT